MTSTRVLLIEDDPMVREVNRQFIERVEGFTVIDMSGNGVDGISKIKALKPDLVLMDIFMPEQDGIETLRKIRNENLPVDVIAVTAANDMQTIQKILHLGVYDYIMKPFTFERMQQTLKNFDRFKRMTNSVNDVTQKELDEMIHHFREGEAPLDTSLEDIIDLPKGFNRTTLEKVLNYIKQTKNSASADDVASNIGVARVTARRYLDFLEKQKLIKVDVHYGGIGRPINHYYI